jgi:hypothetical protein
MPGIAWLSGLLLASPSLAVEVPAFRQGLWQYERSVGASKFVARECGDPSQDMLAKNASMEKMGCKLSSSAPTGGTFSYTAECVVKLPSGAASWTSTSTLTVEGNTGYRLEIHSTRGPIDEIVVAQRVADCAK